MSQEIELLHKPFRKWLDAAGICYTYHRPDKATGSTLGDADFILYNCNRVLMLEFKDKETRVSADQRKRHAELARAGCIVQIHRQLDTATRAAQEWLGTASATLTPATQKDASTGILEGKDWPACYGQNADTGKTEVVCLDCELAHDPKTQCGHAAYVAESSPVNGTEPFPPGKVVRPKHNGRAGRPGDRNTHFTTEPVPHPATGTVNPGQAFLDSIPHTSERIGEWQGQSWLIRMDKRGQEYFVRRATANDLARLKTV